MELDGRIRQAQRENPGVRIDCYVLFESHTDAMQLFDVARAAGLRARISATPRQARSSCGVALLVDCDESARIVEIAREAAVPIEDVVPLPNQIHPRRDVYC